MVGSSRQHAHITRRPDAQVETPVDVRKPPTAHRLHTRRHYIVKRVMDGARRENVNDAPLIRAHRALLPTGHEMLGESAVTPALVGLQSLGKLLRDGAASYTKNGLTTGNHNSTSET